MFIALFENEVWNIDEDWDSLIQSLESDIQESFSDLIVIEEWSCEEGVWWPRRNWQGEIHDNCFSVYHSRNY